jgi:hypothetical protein
MGARKSIGTVFTWLGGGQEESATPAEKAGYQVAGMLGLLNGALAWLAATVAVAASTSLPVTAILPFTLIVGLVLTAMSRALAAGPRRSRAGILGRAAVAAFVGLVVGELAGISLFSGPIDRALDADAQRQAASAPAVIADTHTLDQLKAKRATLDSDVGSAQDYVTKQLVVARCEFDPAAAACPRTEITGVPGDGPETQTADDRLAQAQTALAAVTKTRDGVDADIVKASKDLSAAQTAAGANIDRSLGARWVAMHDYTVAHTGALLSRLVVDLFFILLTAFALILRLWRGETELDRREQAKAARHQAEEDAATAIAVKQAEARVAAETLKAEQELERLRIEAEAQTAIEREQHRQRVLAVAGSTVPELVSSVREQLALPAAEQPRALPRPPVRRNGPLSYVPDFIPVPDGVVDASNAASEMVQPFLPPVLAKALRIRSEIEEVEEVKLSYRRTRKETHTAEYQPEQDDAPAEPVVKRVIAEQVQWNPDDGLAVDTSSDTLTEIVAPAKKRDRADVGHKKQKKLAEKKKQKALPPGKSSKKK